jgi:hypothetical protein
VSARLEALLRGGWLQVAVALGVGYATVTLATDIANVIVGVIAQHVPTPSEPSSVLGNLNLFSGEPFLLSFHVGSTVIVYGYALAALLALVVVLAVRAALNAYARRDLQPCPHCLTLMPAAAAVCRSCSLEVEPEA